MCTRFFGKPIFVQISSTVQSPNINILSAEMPTNVKHWCLTLVSKLVYNLCQTNVKPFSNFQIHLR